MKKSLILNKYNFEKILFWKRVILKKATESFLSFSVVIIQKKSLNKRLSKAISFNDFQSVVNAFKPFITIKPKKLGPLKMFFFLSKNIIVI